jgi:hypothetical protein
MMKWMLKRIADLFNKYFASVFDKDSDLLTKDHFNTRNIDDNCLSDIDLTVDDMYTPWMNTRWYP